MLSRSARASLLTVVLALLWTGLAAVPGSVARAESDRSTLPLNPWAGPAGTSTMHGDPGSSDTTPYAGPGADAATTPIPLGSVCPTILAGADGMPVALCTEYSDRAPTVNLLDPQSFVPVARLHLTAGALLGGVYAYIDHRDRLVTVDGSGAVLLIGHHRTGLGGTWELTIDRRFSYTAAMTAACGSADCDAIVSVAPGYDGRIWFATAAGRAGYVDPRRGRVVLADLSRRKESVANSISTSPDGVAVTTTHATYLLRAHRGSIRRIWARAYDRGSARKPGQLSRGSGATPTFFGPRSGHEFVAILDNADRQEHLLVYRAATGRTVCSIPVFEPGTSGSENSPVGIGRSVYVASTYGYPYPAGYDGPSEPASADIAGGLQRIDVRRSGCRLRWTSDVRSAAVPRFARAEGVLYTVTRSETLAYDLVRIDPADGDVLSATPLGEGPGADTLQMVGTILPDRTLLQGNLNGLTVTRPAA